MVTKKCIFQMHSSLCNMKEISARSGCEFFFVISQDEEVFLCSIKLQFELDPQKTLVH